MKGLRQFVLYAVLSILILTFSRPAFACVCGGAQQPPCFAFQEATAVFAGQVVDTSVTPLQDGETFHSLLVQFSVEQSFKGISTPQVRVATITGTDCDFGFQKGEEYFVYAYLDSKYNRLATGVCTRTRRLSYAKEDLDYVRGINDSTPRSLLLGADNALSSLLEGSEIIIKDKENDMRRLQISEERSRLS